MSLSAAYYRLLKFRKKMSRSAPETASTRRVEKMRGSHLFKIMGYSIEKRNGKEIILESATFNVAGYDWSIKFYPNGNGYTMAEKDQTSIYLSLKSEAQNVIAQPTFVILNQYEQPLLGSKTTDVCTFSQKNQAYGFRSFVKRFALESLLKDDSLVIRCTVTVFKPFPVEVEPGFPLVVPPPDKQQLSHLLEDGYAADVTFKVHGQTFNAHKCILAARSQVFRARFSAPLKEKSDTAIEIEDMEAPVFKSLLHFIYSETVPEFEERNGSKNDHNSKLMAQHLLVAADRYGLERLKIMCESILYSSIDRSNVVTLLSLAKMHNCIHLKRACLQFSASHKICEGSSI